MGKVNAQVAQLKIVARGRVEADGSSRYFVAGKDRFLLVESAAVPTGKTLSITATADDAKQPLQLKILESKPLP